MFENSIFKIEFSILLGLFPHHNLYRLTFQSFVLREYVLKVYKLMNTMASFKLQFSLGFVTSCYVIMNISIA